MRLGLALACTWVLQAMFVAAVAGLSLMFQESGFALLREDGSFLLTE